MGKKSKKGAVASSLPNTPWVYMNDPTENYRVTWALNQILPKSAMYSSPSDTAVSWPDLLTATLKLDSMIPIVYDRYSDVGVNLTDKITSMNGLRKAAVKCGSNFVSVNIYQGDGKGTKKKDLKKWGTNHLEIQAKSNDAKDWVEVAEKIYRWLCMCFKLLVRSAVMPANVPRSSSQSLHSSRDAPSHPRRGDEGQGRQILPRL